MIDLTTVATVFGAAVAATAGAGITILAARRGQQAQRELADSQTAVNWEGIANRAQLRNDLLLAALAKLQDQHDGEVVWQRKAAILLEHCADKDASQRAAIIELLKLTNEAGVQAHEVRARIKQITESNDAEKEINGHTVTR